MFRTKENRFGGRFGGTFGAFSLSFNKDCLPMERIFQSNFQVDEAKQQWSRLNRNIFCMSNLFLAKETQNPIMSGSFP